MTDHDWQVVLLVAAALAFAAAALPTLVRVPKVNLTAVGLLALTIAGLVRL